MAAVRSSTVTCGAELFSKPSTMSAAIPDRVLRPRVVRCNDHEIGQPAGDGGHQGTLRPVAISPTAEQRHEVAARESARGFEQAAQGVTGVGKVHHRRDRVAGAGHHLHAARNVRHRRDAPLDGALRQIERGPGRGRGQDVVRVAAANQPRLQVERAPRRAQVQLDAPGGQLHAQRAHVRHCIDGIGHGPLRLGSQQAPVRIVHVDHGGRTRIHHSEQPALGVEIAGHVAVKIEMVVSQVREHGSAEADAVHAAQRQGM